MSIARRTGPGGKTRYQVRWRAEGRRFAKTFDIYEDARDHEAEVRRAAQLGAHAPRRASRLTLGDWLDTWWERRAEWATSTTRARRSVLTRLVVPKLDNVRLSDLGVERLLKWRTELIREGHSAHQVNAARSALSSALGAAVDAGLLPTNPMLRVRTVPATPSSRRAHGVAVCEAIRAELPGTDRLGWVLMCYGGLRPAEMAALRWEKVQSTNMLVDRSRDPVFGEKRTKTERPRTVPLIQPLRDDLETERLARGWVVPGPIGGMLNPNNWYRRRFVPARERAGVDVQPYEGRHTFGTLALYGGWSVMDVSAAMGHARPSTTFDHYAHVIADAQMEWRGWNLEQAIYDERKASP